jgi:hypothetical protein
MLATLINIGTADPSQAAAAPLAWEVKRSRPRAAGSPLDERKGASSSSSIFRLECTYYLQNKTNENSIVSPRARGKEIGDHCNLIILCSICLNLNLTMMHESGFNLEC